MSNAASETLGATAAVRGSIIHFLGDPSKVPPSDSFEYFEDGLLVVEDGKVKQVGSAAELLRSLDGEPEVTHYPNSLITPGFVDTHLHYPQTEIIGAYGEQLLDWLEKYTFPTENKYRDKDYARATAKVFVQELLRNGTTTALVFATVHKDATEALFEEARRFDLRLIAGKVMMDRNAPDYLLDTPQTSYEDTKALIQKWHGNGRLLYAVTPRFAPTSTSEQLEVAGKLKREHPDVYVQTHVSENEDEVAWVNSLFPEAKGYLDVYDRYGLLSSRSVFAHGIHLTDDEFRRLSETGSCISFCPTSNLFLGSGLFKLETARRFNVNVSMGTDVGAGTSFSMLQTLNEAYKVVQLQKQKLSSFRAFFLATLGGAESLRLADKIGNFTPGKEADFVVLDCGATPLLRFRMPQAQQIDEKLFVLMTIGDDRVVRATYVCGKLAHDRDRPGAAGSPLP